MDSQMPVTDGCAAVRELRAAGYRAPIVALTAHTLKEEVDRCLEAGCDDCAAKPIGREALVALVARYAERAKRPAPQRSEVLTDQAAGPSPAAVPLDAEPEGPAEPPAAV